ncbi:MAG: ARMT1-like domain-containing protein [Anaerolineae bacterium]|jgi:uncharacterized protein with ATP-grasp and redox domains
MKATPACIPCYLRQALSATREVVSDSEKQKMVLNEVAKLLPDLPLDSTPARNSTYVLWRVQDLVGCPDPFASKKEHYTELALKMYPQLKAIVQASPQRLSAAVRVAAAGNIIDLGILDRDDVDLMGVLNEILIQGFTVDECGLFEAQLARVDRVLYLLDNAGETVFDRVLIEELAASGVQTTVAAKGEAILNDATMEDAIAAGLDEVAHLISNGSPMIGTELESCSVEFLRHFDAADLVVSKGQANFETLNETSAPLFFILKAKCDEVARELGVSTGDVVAEFNRL